MSASTGHSANLRRLCCFAIALSAVALANVVFAQQQAGDTYPMQFRIDSESSWLRVLVYRGGLLRGFGHNHVISHGGIRGTLLVGLDPLQSELRLEFDVADLLVDDPQQRTLAGADFPGQIAAKDIAGTRQNMLGGRLLQAEQHPTIRIRSDRITGSMPEIEVAASIAIRGQEFAVKFPARVELSGESILASGELAIRHGALGLEPFKAALGTLRVRDTLVLQYQITGTRTIAAGGKEP